MRITFLGTNGWYDSPMGNTLCILITTEEYNIILDAGSGLAKADAFLDQGKPTFLFLSHFHLDHLVGLHALVKFRFLRPLTFLIREGSTKALRNFVDKPYTVPLDALPFKYRILELPNKTDTLPFPAYVLDMIHPDPTMGIRLNIDDKVVAFCPDTGYCLNCVELAKNADILIAECAYLPGETNTDWPHLNPELGAKIAQESNARQLILTHFDAARYSTLEDREQALRHARLTFSNTLISTDGLQILLS